MDGIVAAGTGTTLRLCHRFEAAPERVFAAWTRPEALKLWWCPTGWHPAEITVDLRPGGSYRLAMHEASGMRLITVHGEFLEIEPGRRLVYTWRWDGAFPEMPETRVTVEFHAAGGGTELVLRQESLVMRFCALHLSGWLVAWDRLARTVVRPTLQTSTTSILLAGDLTI